MAESRIKFLEKTPTKIEDWKLEQKLEQSYESFTLQQNSE